MILSAVDEVVARAKADFVAVQSDAELEQVKALYLGKQGLLTKAFAHLKTLAGDDKKRQGALLNRAKAAIEAALSEAKARLREQAIAHALQKESIDVTLPGIGLGKGSLHPVTIILQEITDFFARAGFAIAVGPEVEDDEHNFTALNIGSDHPARACTIRSILKKISFCARIPRQCKSATCAPISLHCALLRPAVSTGGIWI